MTNLIRTATAADLGELFTLQRAAFVDEATLYGTPDVPALTESIDDFTARHGRSTTFVSERGPRIIGAVSLIRHDELFDVERLMTAPDARGSGVASALMTHVDDHLRASGESAVQLVVGERAEDNRRLYGRLGYAETARWASAEFPDVVLIRMIKQLT